MKIILPDEALQKIRESKGKIFTVIFRRKRDKKETDPQTKERKITAYAGDAREMNCRTNVKNRRNNNIYKRYNTLSASDLIRVYDLKNQGYRSFSWRNILSLKIKKEEYLVLSHEVLDFCRTHPKHPLTKKVKKNNIEIPDF